MANAKTVFQLFYVSSAVPGCSEDQIDSMLKKAREYNKSQGLTGILLFRGGIFLQLLEGDEEKVNRLYEKIAANSLHRNLVKIFAKGGNPPIFSDWSMAYREVSDVDVAMVNEMLSWNKLIAANPEIDNDLILLMLEKFKTVKKKHP